MSIESAIIKVGYTTRSTPLTNTYKLYRIHVVLANILKITVTSKDIIKRIKNFQKLFIILNANLGSIFSEGFLSQEIYLNSQRTRMQIITKYDDKQGKITRKQLERYSEYYESYCIPPNCIITVDLFRFINTFILN